MATPLSPQLNQVLEKRDLWRRLHQQGDQAGVHRLLGDTHLRDLQTEPFSSHLPSGYERKLSAFGREWERAIVAQAVKEQAEFGDVLLYLDPSQVVQFQAVVEERLRKPEPWGAFLFVESAIPLELTKESWKAQAHFIFGRGNSMADLDLATCPGVIHVGEREKVLT